MKKLFLIALIFITACSTPQPQVTVTAPPTVTAALTSTPQPTSTPVPPPTLTFTPTAVTYSAEQLESMTDDAKIAAAREMVGDAFGDKTITGESVDGSEVILYSTYRTTDEWGKSVERTYTLGGVDLETGEVIPGYTPKELPAMHAEGTIPEQFYFNGELVSKVVDTESALARAQEATYQDVDYLAEITYWQNEEGEIVLVDWPYWPGGPRELMSYSASQDGRLVNLMPVVFEFRLSLENLSAGELQAIFTRLMRDQKNADLLEVVNDPEGVVIAVNGLDSTAKNYWEGDEAESRKTSLMHWVKQVNEQTKVYTFDRRNPGVGVAHYIRPDRLTEDARTIATQDGGRWVALSMSANLVGTNQDSKSFLNYDRNYDDPHGDVTIMLREFGIRFVMFDSEKND